jgi:hypothetical protein
MLQRGGLRSLPVAALMFAALLTAGCGSSGSSGASAPSAPVVSATQAVNQVDQARAEAALFTQDDFPAAFYPQPPSKEGPLCVDEKGITLHGTATSHVFTRDDASYAMFVQNRVIVAQSEDAAKTFYVRATKGEAFDCVAKLITKPNAEDKANDRTWRHTESSNLDDPGLGDESHAVRLSFEVSTQGQSFPVIVDMILVRVGDSVNAMQFINVGGPFDETSANFQGPTTHDLAAASVARMQPAA